MLPSYSFFKLVFPVGPYTTISELSMYESADGTGPNLLLGGTASSNGNYGSQFPGYAIDGDPSTFWESSSRIAGSPAELTIELPDPVSPRSLKIVSTPYPAERPAQFGLMGSNDGLTWEIIRRFSGWFSNGASEASGVLHYFVSGVSKLATGEPSQRVLVHNWETGELIAERTPRADGSWMVRDFDGVTPVLVTHIGPTGYRPQGDGPITTHWW